MFSFFPILAENFDGLGMFVFGFPLILIALAALSFIPAVRGHWAAPVLAGPGLVLGFILFLGSAAGSAPFGILLLSLLPALIALASLTLWCNCRSFRKSD